VGSICHAPVISNVPRIEERIAVSPLLFDPLRKWRKVVINGLRRTASRKVVTNLRHFN